MAKDPLSEFATPDAAALSGGSHDAHVSGGGFFGHPRGLATLFFTEMWERFSFYGMRALLVLFMTAAAVGTNPGMGLETGRATAIYGLYTFFVYVLALPGGWIADNLWGQRKSVFVGGCIIAAGHFAMAIPSNGAFFVGLLLIVIGTGLLKPNVSTMVGDLYPEGGARRDAGFSIFYTGINLGAFFGPILCGFLAEGYNWHWGFSLAGIGMVLGLIQYKLGDKHLGEAGTYRGGADAATLANRSKIAYGASAAFVVVMLVVGYLIAGDGLPVSVRQIAGVLGVSVAVLAVAFFAQLINGSKGVVGVLLLTLVGFGAAAVILDRSEFERSVRDSEQIVVTEQAGLESMRADPSATLSEDQASRLEVLQRRTPMDEAAIQGEASLQFYLFCYQIGVGVLIVGFLLFNAGYFLKTTQTIEKQRLFVIFWLFILSALFWSGFEQAGSSLNLFAADLTDRAVGGWEVPASWLQSVNSLFIIMLAPVFGFGWTWLAARNANPSIPVKFALGLIGLAVGFFVLSWGAANATPDSPVSPAWLIVTYFFHTAGELMLSPVGLSSITKLAPSSRVGQMMGMWFVSVSLGNLIAGLVAGQLETLAPASLFSTVALIVGAGGIVALLLAPPVQKLIGDMR